jgi:L-threonylcarbamoyladenylate synthase
MTVDPPQILRPGGMPIEVLRQTIGNIELHPVVLADREILLEKTHSPGIKHRHYAPDADLIVVEGEMLSVVKKIQKLIASFAKKGNAVGVLCTDETVSNYSAYKVHSLGTRKDSSIIAKNLFKLLREFDSEGVDIIIAEGIPLDGFGLAVMNRLRRSSGYKIVKV